MIKDGQTYDYQCRNVSAASMLHYVYTALLACKHLSILHTSAVCVIL